MRHSISTRGTALGLLELAVDWGCGSEPTPPVSLPISVTVSPPTVSVVTGGRSAGATARARSTSPTIQAGTARPLGGHDKQVHIAQVRAQLGCRALLGVASGTEFLLR